MTNPLPRIDPEFKALIPPLSQDEYNQLEQNILLYKKCRDAIIIWDGTIVDGHNRFGICAKHGISFEIKEMAFESREDAKLWILDNQLGRRNLTDAMRIELALCKTELLRKKAKENQIAAGGDKTRPGALSAKMPKPINVDKIVSDESGVGDGTVKRYAHIKKHADPDLLQKVQSGEVKIGTAHRLLDPQVKKELKRLGDMYRFIAKHIHLVQNEADKQALDERLADLQGHLAVLMGGQA